MEDWIGEAWTGVEWIVVEVVYQRGDIAVVYCQASTALQCSNSYLVLLAGILARWSVSSCLVPWIEPARESQAIHRPW